MTICKECVIELFSKIYSKFQDRRESMLVFCSTMDIPFSESIYDMAVHAFATRGDAEEYKIATAYLSFLNSNVGKSAGTTFSDSDIFSRLFDAGGGFDSNAQFKIDKAKEENLTLNERITDLELENSSLLKENSILKPENTKLQSRLTAAETAAATFRISAEQEVARKEGLKIQLESEINRISSELSITKLNLSDTGKKLKEKIEECASLQKTINSYNKQNLVLESGADNAAKKLSEYAEKKEKELSELSEKYEADIKSLKNRISELLIQLEDEKNSNKIVAVEIQPEEKKEEIPEEYIKEWGEGLSLKDYEFMVDEIADWKNKHEITKKAEDLLLHKIVRLELKIRNIEKIDGDTSEELKALQTLIKTANFIERKSINANIVGGEKDTFGEWIKDIEDHAPAEWYKNQKKFKDIEGITPYLNKHVTRSLKNFITGSRDFDSSMELLSGDDKSE